MDNEPEPWESRREGIRQRLEALHTRIDELKAQRHVAASQAAEDEAVAASVRAFRQAAEAHEHADLQHERAAAAGSGDKDEHERQAAFHRAAATADRQRAERARSLL